MGDKGRSREDHPHERSTSAPRDGYKRVFYKSPSRSSRSRSRSRRRSKRGSRYRSRSRSSRRYKSRYSRSRSRSGSSSRSRSSSNSRRRRSYSRSPMSNRKRHNGNRDNPQPSRCLGVFGLSICTKESHINYIFSKYGPVERVQVVIDSKTGRSRGFCFVYFENHEDAKVAKEQCTGMEIDGRTIRVDYSITHRAHTPTPGIYMGRPTYGSRGSRRYRSPSPRSRRRRSYRSRSRSRSR